MAIAGNITFEKKFDAKFFSIGCGAAVLINALFLLYGFSQNNSVAEFRSAELPSVIISVHSEKKTAEPSASLSQSTLSTPPTEKSKDLFNTLYSRQGDYFVPQRGPNGESVFMTFAKQNHYPDSRPLSEKKLAIVFIDSGVYPDLLAMAQKSLPSAFTYAFSPYAPDLQNQINKETENWIMLPVQPENFPFNDNGPLALNPESSSDDWHSVILQIASLTPHIVGFAEDPNTSFISSARAKNAMEDHLTRLGFGYIKRSKNYSLATLLDAPNTQADLILDQNPQAEQIRARLKDLEDLAGSTGSALAYAHLYPQTIEVLQSWLQSLEGKNISLVPASQLVTGSF